MPFLMKQWITEDELKIVYIYSRAGCSEDSPTVTLKTGDLTPEQESTIVAAKQKELSGTVAKDWGTSFYSWLYMPLSSTGEDLKFRSRFATRRCQGEYLKKVMPLMTVAGTSYLEKEYEELRETLCSWDYSKEGEVDNW